MLEQLANMTNDFSQLKFRDVTMDFEKENMKNFSEDTEQLFLTISQMILGVLGIWVVNCTTNVILSGHIHETFSKLDMATSSC